MEISLSEEEIKPRLIVVAGPNGVGKTSITQLLLYHEWMQGCEYINPDYIALHEYGNWDNTENFIKAAEIAKQRREDCLKKKKNLAFETVFSTVEKTEFIRKALESGFFVRFFFICVNDPTICAQRVAQRVMHGGHDVPISRIIDRYYRSFNNCIIIANHIDRAYFYDNSTNNDKPHLLFRLKKGTPKIHTQNEMPFWGKKMFNHIITESQSSDFDGYNCIRPKI
ncbi:MAG TPA: zeta toxin family protein [Desulfohalobiaceae bacterium]|nr:zeta toxin family protein [Desulfohalobiaceae bacterium]